MLLDEIKAFPVLNSSGEWTIKVVAKAGKLSASAIVPGGHSVGIHEKRVIRYFNAIRRIRALSKKLAGSDLADIDSLIRKEAGNVSTGNQNTNTETNNTTIELDETDNPLVNFTEEWNFSEINETRNMLYRLYDVNLVSFIRKKDKV